MQPGVWLCLALRECSRCLTRLSAVQVCHQELYSSQRSLSRYAARSLTQLGAVRVCSQEFDSSPRCPGMQPGVWLYLVLWECSQELDSAWRCPGMQPGLRLSSSLPGNSAVVWLSSALSGCVAMSLTQLGTVRVQHVARSLTQLDVVAGYAAGSLTQRGLGQCKTVGKCFVCCLNYIQNGNNHNSS